MPKPTALEKIKKIQGMRASGKTFEEIARATSLSHSTVHRHGKEFSSEQDRHTMNVCRHQYMDLFCERHNGHRGVHLANNKKGGLIYWE